MKRIISTLILLTLVLTGCSSVSGQSDVIQSISAMAVSEVAAQSLAPEEQSAADTTAQQASVSASEPLSIEYDLEDLGTVVDAAEITTIELSGDTVSFQGSGVEVAGSIVTITSAGTYSISGFLNDGQVIVDSADEETVTLVLNGAQITSTTSAPIYVSSAEKVIITLAEGTENTVADGTAYVYADPETDEPNAAIFSKDDLTINGSGSLIVNANYNNGIASKDDLKITGGVITVNAVNDGIKGKDTLAVLDGIITINAGSDGMQATNTEDIEKGNIIIEGGIFNINTGLDGLQAETSLLISGGEFTIIAGGGSVNSTQTANNQGMRDKSGMDNTAAAVTAEDGTESTKGLKAGVDLTITGGIFTIDSADDSLHSNDSLTIDGGEFNIKSGDDGVRAEYSLNINSGMVNIVESFEGLESNVITINGGEIRIIASDDAINASSGLGGGQDDGSQVNLNGGYVVINSTGDGFDSNGSAVMTGGVLIVEGTTFNNNGPLDVNGTLKVDGGLMIAAGSAGMPEIPDTSSIQNTIAMVLDAVQTGGTIIHIESVDGEEILTYAPPKDYQLFVFSSPELQTGSAYTITVGGSSDGADTDGLYTGGTYLAGTQVASVEITSSVTTVGPITSNMGGGKHGRP